MSNLVSNQSTDLATPEEQQRREAAMRMLREVTCKDHTDDEFQFFLGVAERYKLDPVLKQIYSIKRGGRQCFQIGIDGFRTIAHRTKRCAGISAPVFTYVRDKNGNPSRQVETATCTVKVVLPNNQIGEFSATVWMDEFNAGNQFYKRMPHVQLGKVAEAHAIRRAFPVETGAMYVQEEFHAADEREQAQKEIRTVRNEQVNKSDEKLAALNELKKALAEKCRNMTMQEKGEFLFKVCMLKNWDDAKMLPAHSLQALAKKVGEYVEPPPQPKPPTSANEATFVLDSHAQEKG